MRNFDGFGKYNHDEQIEEDIVQHCKKHKITPLDGIKLFPVLGRRQLLKRFLAHTELFKQTLDVPGDIAELGVFRGFDLMTWANLLEAYSIGDRTKIIYGFDNWKGFTSFSPEDGKQDNQIQKKVGGFSPGKYYDELNDAIKIFDQDRFVPWKPRIKLIRGNIEDTIPAFCKENIGVRFSLIHVDCDLFLPTKIALDNLWSRLSRGGIIIFDEYSLSSWPGETQAVDEFFADKPNITIKKFSWTNAPAGYVIKE